MCCLATVLLGNSLADLWPRVYDQNTVIPANKFAVKKLSYATTVDQQKYEDMWLKTLTYCARMDGNSLLASLVECQICQCDDLEYIDLYFRRVI